MCSSSSLAPRKSLARAYRPDAFAQTGQTDRRRVRRSTTTPDLFAKRRIPPTCRSSTSACRPRRQDELRAQVDQARNFPELINWLRAQNIPFAAGGGVKPAEQLRSRPCRALPR